MFTVRPYHHRNIARAILKAPKVYFFDSGLVKGDSGARLENACAAMLLKHVHYRQAANHAAPAYPHGRKRINSHP